MSPAGAPPLHTVVLAGGAGERFWPRSRRARPKPLLRLGDGRSLLAQSLARAARVAPAERRWLLCGAEHAAALRREARLPRGHVLVEPRARNTAMAAAWAALRISREDPEALLALLPADHLIPDARAFAAALRRAARAAAAAEVLVTLGVRPTRPEPGYGYLRLGPPVGPAHPGLHRVARFVEKPSESRARRFLRDGGFLWNAGIFVWRARVLLEEIERCAPSLWRALAPLREHPMRREALARSYRRAPAQPIDTAVLERSRRIWTLPVTFRWSDVGTWASLAAELGVGRGQSRVVAGEAILEQSPGNLVWGGTRPVALLGVEGLAVIDTDDALLVARLDRSGDLRRVVARLRRQGHTRLT